jgi:tetratricopeptide (TPR) repeat protein
LAVVALAALSVWFWQPWRAELYANVGAVEMARHELNGFPEARWDERKDLSDLKLARRYLSYALELDPNNRAATYRLGLIAMLEGNFAEATPRLEAALTGRTIPRGLAKTLGYSHTWLGNYERASELLLLVPEARYEMQVFSWWWGTQNRPDLAERAAEMELRLAALGAEVNSDPLTTQP